MNGEYEEFGEERFVGSLMLSSHDSLDKQLKQAVKYAIQFAEGDPADDLSIVALARDQQPSSSIVTMRPEDREKLNENSENSSSSGSASSSGSSFRAGN